MRRDLAAQEHQHSRDRAVIPPAWPGAVAVCQGDYGRTKPRARRVHQLFLKLLEDESLRQATDVKAYLFACVRNAALNDVRVRGRNVELVNEEIAWFEPPLRDYAEEASLRHALAELPDDQRQVTVLHIWGELTFAQIADLLDISANTAASRYRYALARLRESMCAKENPCADSR